MSKQVLPNRQYSIKLHGSGRISLRNRCHLKKIINIKPHTPILNNKIDHCKVITTENVIETEKSSDTPITSKTPAENNTTHKQTLRKSTHKQQPPKRYIEEI